jgi:galactonate dehydratase
MFAHAATRTRASLTLRAVTLPDPDGHHDALKLKGDWVLLGISDGRHTGIGEVSHSGDDRACVHRARELFRSQLTGDFEPELTRIRTLEHATWSTASHFVTATAISGLNQALYDLAAQRAGVPVWRLIQPTGDPQCREVPCYLQLNRTLRQRTTSDFLRAVETGLQLGVSAVKITPFEAVTSGSDHLKNAEAGFERLEAVRRAFPEISLRVDCHARFTADEAVSLLPRFTALKLEWLEEPCPPDAGLAKVRAATSIPIATGELFFGDGDFRQLLQLGRADVIMPDPKHVGGFGPLVRVCRMAETLAGQVSPHNPSGPVATCAALHAAAGSRAVTSTELILTSDPKRQPGRDLLQRGRLRVPEVPGWGVPDEVSKQVASAEILERPR